MTFSTQTKILAEITGPVVIVGFGSIGSAFLPILFRHLKFDKSRVVIVDPESLYPEVATTFGLDIIVQAVEKENYKALLTPLLTAGGGRGFLVNMSVDTCSVELLRLCRELDCHYIDTVVEPWPGYYWNPKADASLRTNHSLRETLLAEKVAAGPNSISQISCCGANPGMVSWMVKQGLVNLAKDLKVPDFVEPSCEDRQGWARLMQTVGVKGIHIAERDTQYAAAPKPPGVFVCTWSVDGFLSEAKQPAEMGFGTHEKWQPTNARAHPYGVSRPGIYLLQPGGNTRVRSWCPTLGPQYGCLVTHNESLSITDYFTVWDDKAKQQAEQKAVSAGPSTVPNHGPGVLYRPTCHYAYHPPDASVLSLWEMFGQAEVPQKKVHLLTEKEIVDGSDELGVLMYGHGKNAYWFGSQLSIQQTRKLAPHQNATALQVTSALLAGIVWCLENPNKGLREAEEIDYKRCLEIQIPYLGTVAGYYTDWNPLQGRPGNLTFFPLAVLFLSSFCFLMLDVVL